MYFYGAKSTLFAKRELFAKGVLIKSGINYKNYVYAKMDLFFRAYFLVVG
jgi:hypothetical protein